MKHSEGAAEGRMKNDVQKEQDIYIISNHTVRQAEHNAHANPTPIPNAIGGCSEL